MYCTVPGANAALLYLRQAALLANGVKRQFDAIVPEDLGQVASTASEDVHIASMWVTVQTLLNLQRQTLHATPHVV